MLWIFLIIAIICGIYVIYGIYEMYWYIRSRRIENKLDKISIKVTDLKTNYLLYNLRKVFVDNDKICYDTIFSFDYEDEEIVISSTTSQKIIIRELYDKINEIDKIIEFLEKTDFEILGDDTPVIKVYNTFYELKRTIRQEKLFYENTVF